MVRGLAAVAEGREQPPKPLALPEDALPCAPLVYELAAEALVLGREGPEFGMGRACRGGLGLLAPSFKRGLDVAGEELGQVVVAVELVLVVDAGEGGMGVATWAMSAMLPQPRFAGMAKMAGSLRRCAIVG